MSEGGLPGFYVWRVGQPAQPTSAPPYDGRGGAKFRSNGKVSLAQPVYGDVYKPSTFSATVPNQYGGSVVDDDTVHIPMIFKLPPSLENQAPQPMVYGSPLPPGAYGRVRTPSHSVVILDRGEYSFESLTLGEGSKLYLTDDSVAPYEPAVVYIEELFSADVDCLINMEPLAGGRDPQAEELQIYGTDGPGALFTLMDFQNGSRFRGIIAGHNTSFSFGELSGSSPSTTGTPSPQGRDGVDFFGALYAKSFYHEPGVRYHYDKALLGKKLEGQTQWVLLNSGNLK